LRDKNKGVTVDSVADTLISAIYGKGLAIDKRNAVSKTSSKNRYLIRFLH